MDPETAPLPCEDQTYQCKTGNQYRILTSVWVAFLFIYVLVIQVLPCADSALPNIWLPLQWVSWQLDVPM